MKPSSGWLCLVAFGLLCGTSTAWAADGWSWRKLWPWGAEEPQTSKSRVVSASAPDAKRTPAAAGRHIVKSKDEDAGLLQRMGDGTKRFFNKTIEVLTPGDDDASRKSSRKSTKDDEESWFSLMKRDETRPSDTVSDFLSQPRP